MNDFEFYLREGTVKKRKPDMELAKSLINDANERFEKISKLDARVFSKIIFENIYDALRSILDALLAIDGYKSYSHEASIAYLKKYGFEGSLIAELNNFRLIRNSSKYYGKDISSEDSYDIIDFYKNHSGKIIQLIRNKLK